MCCYSHNLSIDSIAIYQRASRAVQNPSALPASEQYPGARSAPAKVSVPTGTSILEQLFAFEISFFFSGGRNIILEQLFAFENGFCFLVDEILFWDSYLPSRIEFVFLM